MLAAGKTGPGYRLRPSLGVALIEDTDHLADVTIRTAIRLIETSPGQDNFQYVGPILRSNANATNFYWGGITSHGLVGVGHWSPFAESAAVSVPFSPVSTTVDLELQVVDQTLSLWAWSDDAGFSRPETPQITWDSGFVIEAGAVGLSYNPRGGAGTMSVATFSAIPEPTTLIMMLAIAIVAAPMLKAFTRRRSGFYSRTDGKLLVQF